MSYPALNQNVDFSLGVSPYGLATAGSGTFTASALHLFGSSPGSGLITPDGTHTKPGCDSENIACIGGASYWILTQQVCPTGYATGGNAYVNWNGVNGYLSTSSATTTALAAGVYQPSFVRVTAPLNAVSMNIGYVMQGTPAATALTYVGLCGIWARAGVQLPNFYAGYVVQPSDLNELNQVASLLLNKPFAHISDVTAGTAIGTSLAAIPMVGVASVNVGGVNQIDTDSMWNAANPTRLTVQTPGWYKLRYGITAAVGSASNWLNAVGRVTTGANNPAGAGLTTQSWPSYSTLASPAAAAVSGGGLWPAYMYQGDYFEVEASTAVGSAVTTGTSFSPSYISAEFVSAT